jgi:hypothetical protein
VTEIDNTPITARQTWQLNTYVPPDNIQPPITYAPEMINALNEMERVHGPYTGRQSGLQTFNPGASMLWIADEPAARGVVFPYGDWEVSLVSDEAWGAHYIFNPGYNSNDPLSAPVILQTDMEIRIGYTDGSTFTPFTDGAKIVSSAEKEDPTYLIIHNIFVGMTSERVPPGCYLAFYVKNNSSKIYNIYTGENKYASCLSSPQSDPGYPLPEPASVFLLGASLTCLGGFVLLRRKKIVQNKN